MTILNRPTMRRCEWKDVRERVSEINPVLASAIDKLDPGPEYGIYVASYPFGSAIYKESKLYIPNSEECLVPIDDPTIPTNIREDLDYTHNMPIGLVLTNSAEISWHYQGKTTPFTSMRPGHIFSLWGSLQQKGTSAHTGSMWQMNAGSNSLLMLPKISDIGRYNKIKRAFQLNLPKPKNLYDHRVLFRGIVDSPAFPTAWEMEMLYFSKAWYDSLDDEAWSGLKSTLYQLAWSATTYLRDRYVFDFAFSNAQKVKNLKPNPYLFDVVKYIYAIAVGACLGFKVATDNTVGPIEQIKRIFLDIYGLSTIPTMFYAGFQNQNDPEDIAYYSLEMPVLIDFSPRSQKVYSKINDLREIRHLMRNINSYILEDELGLQQTPIYKVTTQTNYGYYHNDNDLYGEIAHTSELLLDDHILKQEAKSNTELPFCYNGQFLRGCIQIKPSQKGA